MLSKCLPLPHKFVMSTNNFNLLNQFGFVLRLVSQRYARIFNEVVTDEVLPPEISALIVLRQAACSEVDLGALIRTDAGMTSAIVARLLREGFVERTGPADATLLRITETGRLTGQKFDDAAVLISDTALAPLTRYERHVLMELLKKLV